MEGGAADRNHSGEGQGGTHTTPQGTTGGKGGYHGVGGGGPYMIPVRPSPPPPPPMVPRHPPPCGVVWWWVASGVVWFGCGLWWFPPFPPLWRGVGWVVPPLHVGSAWGVW